jgi:hypothetical protein
VVVSVRKILSVTASSSSLIIQKKFRDESSDGKLKIQLL